MERTSREMTSLNCHTNVTLDFQSCLPFVATACLIVPWAAPQFLTAVTHSVLSCLPGQWFGLFSVSAIFLPYFSLDCYGFTGAHCGDKKHASNRQKRITQEEGGWDTQPMSILSNTYLLKNSWFLKHKYNTIFMLKTVVREKFFLSNNQLVLTIPTVERGTIQQISVLYFQCLEVPEVEPGTVVL